MKEYAKEFHTKHLGNCAMAVAAAWLEAHHKDPSEVETFRTCGGGRAEGGLCGALYAAIHYRPDRKEELREEFRKRCNGTLCSEIRPIQSMTCSDRVAVAAELLDKIESSK
ncbi:MAG: hypothetical protein J6Z31_07410 [Fibrobacter sp.]|nr:hypothetical protein [Fibrobacter sp.]